jgi:hypothetical protein
MFSRIGIRRTGVERGGRLLVSLIGTVALVSASPLGSSIASARMDTMRITDCGVTRIPAAGPQPFRVWAKDENCLTGKKLLASTGVARGMPGSSYIPPKIFRTGRFECGYDPGSLMCWVGSKPAKRLSDQGFNQAVGRARRAVLATPVYLQVSAATVREAAVKVVRWLAAQKGKTTSASLNSWAVGCFPNGNKFLPGAPTSSCTVSDTQSPSRCFDQVFLYRTEDAARASVSGWRWDVIGGTAPVFCK